MSWLDRLLGRPGPDDEVELAEDRRALDTLRSSLKAVRGRTDRLIDDYERAEVARLERKHE